MSTEPKRDPEIDDDRTEFYALAFEPKPITICYHHLVLGDGS